MARLTPESKRAFIEQSLKIVSRRKPDQDDANEPETSPYNFLRILLISKSFLFSSIRNKIYRFAIDNESAMRNRELYLTPKSYKCNLQCEFIIPEGLSFDRFFRLFRPQFIGINIEDHWAKVSILELRDFLAVTDAKIGLFMARNIDGLHIARLIYDFRHRIHVLKCDSTFLDAKSSMPPLELEHLYVTKVESIRQIMEILRSHQMRSLKLDFYTREFSGANDTALGISDMVQNKHVRALWLKFSGFDYEEIVKTVTIMSTVCPKLNEVSVDARIESDSDGENLVESTKKVAERMEEMYKEFSARFKKFNVKFLTSHYDLSSQNPQQGRDSFEKISALSVLRDWKVESIVSDSLLLIKNSDTIEATFVRKHDRGELTLRMSAFFLGIAMERLLSASLEDVTTARMQ